MGIHFAAVSSSNDKKRNARKRGEFDFKTHELINGGEGTMAEGHKLFLIKWIWFVPFGDDGRVMVSDTRRLEGRTREK